MKTLLVVITASLLSLAACSSDTAPEADSDSQQNYKNAKIDVDDNVYDITGEVTAEVNSATHQVAPAHGSVGGSQYGSYGSFFGPVEAGKGFVRLKVSTVSPATNLARPGELAILKMTDTKGTALLPGDVAQFRCRAQYEAVAAVREDSSFDKRKVETWELDYCRLARPAVHVK